MPRLFHFARSTRRGRLRMVVLAALLAYSPPVAAQDSGSVGNAAVVAQQCVSCHAAAAVGRRIPPLWGLDQNQFVSAMEAFRSGIRDNPAMMSIARNLSAQQVFDLARYFATQQPTAN